MEWNGSKCVWLWYDLGFYEYQNHSLNGIKLKACLKAPPSPSEFRPEPHETFPLLGLGRHLSTCETKNPSDIGSMWLKCLLTWMADLYGKLVGKYSVHPMDPSGIRLGSFIRLGNVKPKKTWSKHTMITSSTFLTQYPPKFNSSPLQSDRDPIGKDHLPTIFQGKNVKLQGCIPSFFCWFWLYQCQNYKKISASKRWHWWCFLAPDL